MAWLTYTDDSINYTDYQKSLATASVFKVILQIIWVVQSFLIFNFVYLDIENIFKNKL